jgi:hypothetical protein
VYFPHISKIKAGGISTDKYMSRLFDTLIGNFLMIAPEASTRWRLDQGVGNPMAANNVLEIGPAVVGANDSVVRVGGDANGRFGRFSIEVARGGTGATAAIASDYYVLFNLSPGSYTIAPGSQVYQATDFPVNGAQVVMNFQAWTGIGAAFVFNLKDINNVLISTFNLTPQGTISFTLLESAMLEVSLPAVAANTYVTAASTYVRFDWTMQTGRDTGTVSTIKQAIASPQPYVSQYRGGNFEILQIVDSWLVSKSKNSMRQLILDTYARLSGGGSIAAISTTELLSFDWWTSNDVRVGDRLALANTYQKLHEFIISYLPYVLVSPSFIRFLTAI